MAHKIDSEIMLSFPDKAKKNAKATTKKQTFKYIF